MYVNLKLRFVRQEPVLGAGWPRGAAADQGERQHHDQDAGDQAQGPANYNLVRILIF